MQNELAIFDEQIAKLNQTQPLDQSIKENLYYPHIQKEIKDAMADFQFTFK